MNLQTYFHPKRRGNVKIKNNSPVNIRFLAETSDIRNFSEDMRSDAYNIRNGNIDFDASLDPYKNVCYKRYSIHG